MAGRRAGAGLALAAVALSSPGCLGGGATTVTTTVTRTDTTKTLEACRGSQLTGTFAEVPGGAGAGQTEYVLTLKNTSGAGCYMFAGAPSVLLRGARGAPLPTHVVQAEDVTENTPGATLEPGTTATATVRFSPDVPGPGDNQSGACLPKALTLELTATGGGYVDAPIQPPTSVCEQGTLNFDLLKSG